MKDKPFKYKNVSYITRTDPATGQMLPAEGKRKVFISYKHSDETELPLCRTLAEYILAKVDVAVWYDKELTAGEEYDAEIKSAIMQSDVFVLLLSPNILESRYVLEEEVPYARKSNVAIIPIIAGISEKDISEIEGYLGRVHMPVWFFGRHTQAPRFHPDAEKQLIEGLQLSIANKDLIEQAKQFYAKGADRISSRYLNPEQMFIMAYGRLYGVDSEGDKSTGVKIMESILNIYGADTDFARLKEQVSYELIRHLYRSNEPEQCFAYINSALAAGYTQLFPILYNIYGYQWHPELLCYETDMSMRLFERLYQNNFAKSWDAEAVIGCAEQKIIGRAEDPASEQPHIGELRFEGGSAYFRKFDSDRDTVDLIIDSVKVASYEIYASTGDVNFLYLAYDSKRQLVLTLYSDFDHYGPETVTEVRVYRVEKDRIVSYSATSDWLKGQRRLPYTPYTFNIKK